MSRGAERRRPTFGRINNLTIPHGTFNEVHGDYSMNVHLAGQPQEAGLVALSQAISHGSIHDSAERYPAGRCHPGTREEIIETILKWINDPNPSCDVLWIYGPAGAGKSAIMQTIAELLRELYQERYAGSFFFANGKPGRDQGSALFCTLAYQIATYVPGMREAVNSAMAIDITLPKKAMDIQLKSLITEPFLHCRCLPTHTPTILIDGLDECQGSDTQRAILNLIANARTVAGVPLRFLIASRPEYRIRDTFDRYPLFDMTQRVDLSDTRQASLDIKKYLQDGFSEIYETNPDVMTAVERPWPPTRVIDRFVHDASGQFIHASTVLKFVGAQFCDPQTQLDIILTPGPLRASAFSDLDQLYTKILSVFPRRAALIRVLGGLVMKVGPLITLEKCLLMERRELNMVIRAISSLVRKREYEVLFWEEHFESDFETSPPDFDISFCHLSFQEYLLDKNCSGEFAVNLQLLGDELFERGFDLIIISFEEAQSHCDLPMVYDETYRVLGPATKWASSSTIENCVKDLHLSIEEFIGFDNETMIQPKFLLRYLTHAQETLKAIRDSGEIPGLPKSALDNILIEIEIIADEYLRQVLPLSTFLQFRNVPYFTELPFTRVSVSDLLGVSPDLEDRFLIDNAHLLDIEFDLDENEEGLVWGIFKPNANLNRFLYSPSDGGMFHSQFRKHFLRCLLAFLDINPQEVPPSVVTDGDIHLYGDIRPSEEIFSDFPMFLTNFLDDSELSDLKLAEDEEDMRAFINHLCTDDNWTGSGNLRRLLDHPEYTFIVIKWFLRQLNQEPPLPLLDDFRERMINTMGQIYERSVLPQYSKGYFSDDITIEQIQLLSAIIPPVDQSLLAENHSPVPENAIPPYNVRPQVNPLYSLRLGTEYWWESNASFFEITTMVEELLPCPLIDRPKRYTQFLEYYLLVYATHFHSCHRESASLSQFFLDHTRPKYSALYFSQALPSKKILIGLWTLWYLCREMTPRWIVPFGFRSGAIGYLERHGLDSTGDLRLWLEDLTWRPD